LSAPRIISFYLPQYHPIPENDEWWGKGFTEWTNVAKAKPLFKGHYQPHLPADLGFYDLRLPEVREQQAQMARLHGIDGFCYYHYWFNGKQLLDRPFREVLESGAPDFPFCLCWATENWTRKWDGQDDQVLISMDYSAEDDRNHIHMLLPWFADKRYIKEDGKPFILIYRASNMPDPLQTTTIWREEAKKFGFDDLYICNVESTVRDQKDPSIDGFDASVEFQPDWSLFYQLLHRDPISYVLIKLGLISDVFRKNKVLPYKTLVKRALSKKEPDYLRFPCVTPSWDNSCRKKDRCHILINSTPEIYGDWLKEVIRRNYSKSFIFINAWNEWAEGNHLEPDQKNGTGYLDATLEAVNSSNDFFEQERST